MQDDNWESFMALYEACMIARDRLYVHQSQSSKETVKKLDAAILGNYIHEYSYRFF